MRADPPPLRGHGVHGGRALTLTLTLTLTRTLTYTLTITLTITLTLTISLIPILTLVPTLTRYTEDAPVSLGRNVRRNENCVWLADDSLWLPIWKRIAAYMPPRLALTLTLKPNPNPRT